MNKFITLSFCIVLCSIELYSQSMDIFGSMQSLFMHRDNKVSFKNTMLPMQGEESIKNNTFALQQFDLMFSNEFDYNIKAFADVTFNWNYSSEKDWGQFEIQEAWAQIALSDELNIQFGQIIPKFNYNNEYRNKLPILPYIIRPVYYEKILNNLFNVEDLIPNRAFLQLHGIVPLLSNIRLDYSLFLGNSEDSYIITNKESKEYALSDIVSGIDPNTEKEKLIGARLGIHSACETARMGFSFTHDYDNRQDSMFLMWQSPMGSIERWRIGWDMNFNFSGIEIDGEFIYVDYNASPQDFVEEHKLNTHKLMNQEEFYILSYLGSVLYNITDDLFIYTRYNSITNTIDHLNTKDLSFGAGYKILPNVVGKAQYLNHSQSYEIGSNENIYFNFDVDMYVFALSVLF